MPTLKLLIRTARGLDCVLWLIFRGTVELKKKSARVTDLDQEFSFHSGTFVIEYLGEVISYPAFTKRTRVYSEEGQKHFYFMSLKQDEVSADGMVVIKNQRALPIEMKQVIDATRKGGLARFINHSCAPNCTLQKWVVGEHLRMGIFTRKPVAAGQELTFDYKFERYG
jgi:SET domain-containing protein